MKSSSVIVVAMSLLLLSASSVAEDRPPPVDDWTNEVVVVRAQQSGPAFWHLSRGDSEIWILGTLGPMPEKLGWDTTQLAQVIDGARVVLMPPEASANIFEIGWFLLTNSSVLSIPEGKTLEETLPPDLRARFVAARESIKRGADRYEDDPPVVAALKLENDFSKANELSWDEPRQTVEKTARKAHVKVRNIADYSALAMVKEFLRLPPEAGRACLENAVSDVEIRSVHAVPAADAWAVGDVKGIKANYSPGNLEKCAKLTVSFSKLYERGVNDSLAAIDDALAKPGKTVMLVDIGSLLRNTGVAEKLRAHGVVIEGPAE
ncbi:MAG: TraB/GumN family protein [Alphaproteobacteria bacterium]|nr:TraB/GumN family protein [Alphaproteobacteria bacterium]MDE2493285.1 TraB/GumN family protein [Alphaproteobacteria bacterium]